MVYVLCLKFVSVCCAYVRHLMSSSVRFWVELAPIDVAHL
jgi:hypothetical protein